MKADTVEIWHGKIAAEATYYPNYWRILGQAEQVHAGKIADGLLRNRFVEVRGRLRNILAKTLNEQPEKIDIIKTRFGKPYLADYPELAFNLSHSGNALVIAVGCNLQVGVDMETCKPRANLSALVDKCFAEEESFYWHQLPEAQKTSEFYRFWTRKEAFVKATGRGIVLGLKHCVINPQNQVRFLRVPEGYGPALKWHLLDLALEPEVCSALVTDKAVVNVKLNKI